MNDEYQDLNLRYLKLQSQILGLKAEILKIKAEETTEPIMRKYLFAKSDMLMHRQKEIASSHHSSAKETPLDRIEKLLISIDEKLSRTPQTDIEKAVVDKIKNLDVSQCSISYE